MSFWKPKWRPSPKTITRLQALAGGMGLPEPATYQRLYHGHWQRSAGAWAWQALDADGVVLFGSPDPLMDCLRGCERSETSSETIYAVAIGESDA